MSIVYIGNVPWPKGQRREQIYRWSLNIARWFENWYSAYNVVLSSTQAQTNSWSVFLSLGAEGAVSPNTINIYTRVYYNATAYTSSARTLLFYRTSGAALGGTGIIHQNNAVPTGVFSLRYSSTGLNDVAAVRIGAGTLDVKVWGPGGSYAAGQGTYT